MGLPPHISQTLPQESPPSFWRDLFGEEPVIIAGPCALEQRDQFLELSHKLAQLGVAGLRGGAFKPRTSPHSFQGVGEEGLKWLSQAHRETGLPTVTEVLAPHQVELVAEHVQVLQIGSRNMQNFPLLKEVGKSGHPVLLKRGMGNRIEELLLAAEYIFAAGNSKVILCERGIRTFETWTRFTFDINAIALLRQKTGLPVVADPSHGTGLRDLVPAVALAALAAGAHGLLIEVHLEPEKALSDGPQSLDLDTFSRLLHQCHSLWNGLYAEPCPHES